MDNGDGFVSFSTIEFLKLSPGLQRGIVRKSFGILRPGLRDINFGAVERAIGFVARPTKTKQQDLIAGVGIRIEGKRVFLAAWEADLPNLGWPQLPEEKLSFEVPESLEFGDGWRLTAEYSNDLEKSRQAAYANSNPFLAWVDIDELNSPMLVRKRKSGDRFHPLGMDGHSIKLADFFINVKIPSRAREAWPLIIFEDDIVWVPGYRIGHNFRLRSSTRKVGKLKLERTKNR